MKPLAIVRPEPGGSATAKAARRLGLQPLVMPLFEIRPLEWNPPDAGGFDALLFTSANAIRQGGPRLDALLGLPAHCVGEATARAARDYGFKVASVGSGRVDPLLESLPAEIRLLHLGGLHRREPKTPRQSIRVIPVYAAEELAVPQGFREVEECVVAAHSPRAAARVGELVDELGLRRGRIALAAISREAAEAAGTGWEVVLSANEPDDAALLAIAAELCKNPR
jgi:uroporphyrinogen-III synthase